jgi:hypothetical protein
MNELIKKALREAVVDFTQIGPEHKGGFCTFNPKISSYALENKDQLAETIIFVIATQQSDWPTVVAQFKHIINKLRMDGTLYDKEGRFGREMGFYKLIGFMGKQKINPINYLWANRATIYSTVKRILSDWEYGAEDRDAESATFDLFRYFMTLPQLSYAKAGFTVQLVNGRLGCYDSVNTQIYPIPAAQKKVMINKQGRFKPQVKSDDINSKRMQAYITFLDQLKTNSESPHNQELWDRWTHVIAQKINLAGTKELITVKTDDNEVGLKPYQSLQKSNPDIKAYLDKYKSGISGDEISKQHFLPNITDQ